MFHRAVKGVPVELPKGRSSMEVENPQRWEEELLLWKERGVAGSRKLEDYGHGAMRELEESTVRGRD